MANFPQPYHALSPSHHSDPLPALAEVGKEASSLGSNAFCIGGMSKWAKMYRSHLAERGRNPSLYHPPHPHPTLANLAQGPVPTTASNPIPQKGGGTPPPKSMQLSGIGRDLFSV